MAMAMAMTLQAQPMLQLGLQERSNRAGRTPALAASCKAFNGIGGQTLRPSSAQRLASRTLVLRVKATTNNAEALTSSSSSSLGIKEIIPDSEITITKTLFGTIGLTVGIGLLSYGFGAYFTILPGSEILALILTYGFLLTIIGMALKVPSTRSK